MNIYKKTKKFQIIQKKLQKIKKFKIIKDIFHLHKYFKIKKKIKKVKKNKNVYFHIYKNSNYMKHLW